MEFLAEFIFEVVVSGVFPTRPPATMHGMMIRRCVCGGCNRAYFYLQRRTVAAPRAEAERKLGEALGQATEAARCPDCGQFSAEVRRSTLRRAMRIAGACGLLGGCTAMLLVVGGGWPIRDVLGVGVCAGVAIWFVGFLIAWFGGFDDAKYCEVDQVGAVTREAVTLPGNLTMAERDRLAGGEMVVRELVPKGFRSVNSSGRGR